MSLEMHCYPTYEVRSGSISFACRVLKEADYETFEKFGPFIPYAKDKNNAYYGEKIIKNADVKTFGVIKSSSENIIYEYAYDKNTVYFHGKKIKASDPKTFEVLDPVLGKDKNDFYLHGIKLNVDITTFEYTLEGGFFKGKDKNRTYSSCEIREKY